MSAVFDNNMNNKGMKNKRLDVHDILQWLEADDMVDAENAHMLRTLAVGAEYKKETPVRNYCGA